MDDWTGRDITRQCHSPQGSPHTSAREDGRINTCAHDENGSTKTLLEHPSDVSRPWMAMATRYSVGRPDVASTRNYQTHSGSFFRMKGNPFGLHQAPHLDHDRQIRSFLLLFFDALAVVCRMVLICQVVFLWRTATRQPPGAQADTLLHPGHIQTR